MENTAETDALLMEGIRKDSYICLPRTGSLLVKHNVS
jgi:hypothetical protein